MYSLLFSLRLMHLSSYTIQRIPIDRSGTDCQTGCFGLDLRSNLITTNKASKVPIGLLHRQPPTAPKDPSRAPSPLPSLSWACARCAQASSKIKIQAKLHYAAAASVAVVPTAGTQIEPSPYLFLNGGMVGRARLRRFDLTVCALTKL